MVLRDQTTSRARRIAKNVCCLPTLRFTFRVMAPFARIAEAEKRRSLLEPVCEDQLF